MHVRNTRGKKKEKTAQVGEGHILEILEVKTEIRLMQLPMQGFQSWNYLGKPRFRKMGSGSRKPDIIYNNQLVIMNNQVIYIHIYMYLYTHKGYNIYYKYNNIITDRK